MRIYNTGVILIKEWQELWSQSVRLYIPALSLPRSMLLSMGLTFKSGNLHPEYIDHET